MMRREKACRGMKPTRNAKYLAWIRTLPCLVCGRTTGVEAAHTGPHGVAQKSPDTSAVPLCVRHHRTGRDSYHKLGPRAFERRHRFDIRSVVARLNAKPSIRIECSSFMARFGEEDYVLGPVRIGLVSAGRKALIIKSEDRSWCCRDGAASPTIQEFFRVREQLKLEPK
jgi:hypothetical protein